MDKTRLAEFTNNFLASASQMAFVEEAHGTLRLIECFNEVYRYINRDIHTVTLSNELDILETYIEMQKFRYGDKFVFLLSKEKGYADVYIKHLDIIDFVDSVVTEAVTEFEVFITISLNIELFEKYCTASIVLKTDNDKQILTKTLNII